MNMSMFLSVSMCMCGLIWGIFIPACLCLVPISLCVMAVVAHNAEE